MSIHNPPLFDPQDNNKVRNLTFTGVDGRQYCAIDNKWTLSDKAYSINLISEIIDAKKKFRTLPDLVKLILFNPYIFPGVYKTIKETNSYSKYSELFPTSELYLFTLILIILDYYKVDVLKMVHYKLLKFVDVTQSKLFQAILNSNDNNIKVNLRSFYNSQELFMCKDPSPPLILFILHKLQIIDLTKLFTRLIWNRYRYDGSKLNRLSLRRAKSNPGVNTKFPLPDEILINHILPNLNNREFIRFCLINKYYRKLILENDNRLVVELLYKRFNKDNSFEYVMSHHPNMILRKTIEEETYRPTGWKYLYLPSSLSICIKLDYKFSFDELVYIFNAYPKIAYTVKIDYKEMTATDIDVLGDYVKFIIAERLS